MKKLIPLFFLLALGCKKDANNDTSGLIDATIDGVQYHFANLYGGPTYNGEDFGVTYSKESQMPLYDFSVTLKHRNLLTSPYTFTNDYNGTGIQMWFEYRTENAANGFHYFANNWSQSTSNAGFTATVSEVSSGRLKGTFHGGFRKYNNNGTYTQKNITNGTFDVPYQP